MSYKSGHEKVTVEEGQILVDAVDLVVKRRGLRVWNIETHSKYADTLCWDDKGITLAASEHTLKWNRDEIAATRVYLPIPRNWDVLADLHGRYSLTVTAWKPWRLRRSWRRGRAPLHMRRRLLWQREDVAVHSPDPRRDPTGVERKEP